MQSPAPQQKHTSSSHPLLVAHSDRGPRRGSITSPLFGPPFRLGALAATARTVNRRTDESIARAGIRPRFVAGPRRFHSAFAGIKSGRRNAMAVAMPEPDRTVLDRRDAIVAALRAIVPGEGVIAAEREMRPYESDGLTAYRALPMVVVLPETTTQVAQILRYCHGEGIKVVPRGAGTSLSGGALPLADGVLLGMAKVNGMLEMDFGNRLAVVEPGGTNLAVTEARDLSGSYCDAGPFLQLAGHPGRVAGQNAGRLH